VTYVLIVLSMFAIVALVAFTVYATVWPAQSRPGAAVSADPGKTARIAQALTDAARTGTEADFKKVEADLRTVHGDAAMGPAYERLSSTDTVPDGWR
jgi:hypothetical protein